MTYRVLVRGQSVFESDSRDIANSVRVAIIASYHSEGITNFADPRIDPPLYRTVRVEDLQPGNLVDLERDPYMNKELMAEFEHARVESVTVDEEGGVLIEYSVIAPCRYPPGTELEVWNDAEV